MPDDLLMRQLIGNADIFFAGLALARLPIILCDPGLPDTPIVFANPAFLEMCGYPQAEVVGRNCRFLQGPATDPAAVAAIRAALAQARPISLNMLNHRKDGSVFANAVDIHPICDENGEVIYVFGSQLRPEDAAADPRLAQERTLAREAVERCLDARRRLARRITQAMDALDGAPDGADADARIDSARSLLRAAVDDRG